MKRIADKKVVFSSRYLCNGYNATEAAKFAGYSEKTAYSQGQRMLKDVEAKALINKGLMEILEHLEMDKIEWYTEVKALATSNIRNIASFGPDGVILKSSKEIDDDSSRAIESVESVTTYDSEGKKKVTTKIKLHSKTKSLDTWGKFLGMLKEEQTTGVTIVISAEEAKVM